MITALTFLKSTRWKTVSDFFLDQAKGWFAGTVRGGKFRLEEFKSALESSEIPFSNSFERRAWREIRSRIPLRRLGKVDGQESVIDTSKGP